jgi:hypothetical protein
VETLDERAKTEVFAMEYEPIWISDNGVFYWLVIPVARNQYWGNSTNGIKSFEYLNEGENNFIAEGPQDRMTREKGVMGTPITFRLTNKGSNTAIINFAYDIKGIGTLEWDVNSVELVPNQEKDVTARLSIDPSTPSGNYTLRFFFNSTAGIKRISDVEIRVIDKQVEEEKEDPEDNTGMYIIMAAIAVVLILVIIAVIYFMVIKKGDDKKMVSDTSELDELEDEIGTMEAGTGLGLAPQPKAITKKTVTGGSLSPEAPGEEDVPELEEAPEEEEIKLAEEGSDDDWMNLVAKETVDLESQPEVEEDKTHHDSGKSMADLLSEMSSGVEDE